MSDATPDTVPPKAINALVSILMPNYNGMPYLVAAIESVLAQTYPHWELIVCDDGSSDESRSVLEQFAQRDARIRPVFQTKQGVAMARNHAMGIARGQYHALLDSDDVWIADKLELQLNFMQQVGARICHGCYNVIREDGTPIETVKKSKRVLSYHDIMMGHRIDCLTVMIDAHATGQVAFEAGAQEDFAWSLRLMALGYRSYLMPQVLGSYRVRAQSRSSKKWHNAADIWHIMAAEPVSNGYKIYSYANYLFRKIWLHGVRVLKKACA